MRQRVLLQLVVTVAWVARAALVVTDLSAPTTSVVSAARALRAAPEQLVLAPQYKWVDLSDKIF
jgi:hypothetical protein